MHEKQFEEYVKFSNLKRIKRNLQSYENFRLGVL